VPVFYGDYFVLILKSKKNPHLEKSGGGLVVFTSEMSSKANPLYGFIGTSGFLSLSGFY